MRGAPAADHGDGRPRRREDRRGERALPRGEQQRLAPDVPAVPSVVGLLPVRELRAEHEHHGVRGLRQRRRLRRDLRPQLRDLRLELPISLRSKRVKSKSWKPIAS